MNNGILNDMGIFLMVKTFFEHLHSLIADSRLAIELDDGAILSVNLPNKGNAYFYWYKTPDGYDDWSVIKKSGSYFSLKNLQTTVDIAANGETLSIPCEFGYFFDSGLGRRWPDYCRRKEIAEVLAVRLCAHELRHEMQLYHGLKRTRFRSSIPDMNSFHFARMANLYENHLDILLKLSYVEEEIDAIATSHLAAMQWVEIANRDRREAFCEIARLIKE